MLSLAQTLSGSLAYAVSKDTLASWWVSSNIDIIQPLDEMEGLHQDVNVVTIHAMLTFLCRPTMCLHPLDILLSTI